MVQEIAEHEASGLVMHTGEALEANVVVIATVFLQFFLGIRLFNIVVISIFLVRDGILSGLLV